MLFIALFLAVPVLALLACPAVAVFRVIAAPAGARRRALVMWWYAYRWRFIARTCRLAYTDPHLARARPWLPLLPWQSSVVVNDEASLRVRWPRARFRLTAHGWDIHVKLIPRVGREELAAAAVWLADAMAAHRVTVAQDCPGRARLSVLRTDPLAASYPAAACPAGTFGEVFPGRLLVGKDEAGAWRHLALRGVTGITATGLPGSGKSTVLQCWLMQLAGSAAVQFTILDGKGSQEWADWQGRAQVLDDDLEAAEDALLTEAAEMRHRQGVVKDITGYANAWHAGPSPELPLRVVVIDECDRFLNVAAWRGDREAEARSRRLVQLTSGLIRRGRSVLFLVILATQLGLAEAFGNSTVRNNCALSVAFALRTREGSVAALGEAIRDFPDVCPTLYQGPESVGVCTTTLATGLAPFTRIRCPEISEAAAAERARLTAPLRRDPARVTPTPAPEAHRPSLAAVVPLPAQPGTAAAPV